MVKNAIRDWSIELINDDCTWLIQCVEKFHHHVGRQIIPAQIHTVLDSLLSKQELESSYKTLIVKCVEKRKGEMDHRTRFEVVVGMFCDVQPLKQLTPSFEKAFQS